MKILVAVKQVPDTATQVKIGADPGGIDPAGITWIVSPYDEFAVEEALRVKEKRGDGEVAVLTLGPERAKEALRTCLAVSRALAAVIRQEGPQLVFFGRQAIDDDMGAVSTQVAEFLGWPCASWIMQETVSADGSSVRAARQVEGGLEIFDIPLPCVLSAQKGLNEPRYPTLKGIMGAKKKEIRDVKAADLGLGADGPQLFVVALEGLPPRPPGRILSGEPAAAAKELVRSLREDAKAI
jgi:electron transfer flavoprotein beta subunit